MRTVSLEYTYVFNACAVGVNLVGTSNSLRAVKIVLELNSYVHGFILNKRISL